MSYFPRFMGTRIDVFVIIILHVSVDASLGCSIFNHSISCLPLSVYATEVHVYITNNRNGLMSFFLVVHADKVTDKMISIFIGK